MTAQVLLMSAMSCGTWAVTLKIATLAPDGSDWMNKMRRGAEQIAERTEQRVTFKFYPGGVMGDDKSVLRKMRIGQLQGAALASGSLASFYTDSQVYNLPLVFNSFEELDYVRERMDSTIMQGFEDNGLQTFGLSETGFAYAMSKHPVSSVADLQQRKVWIPDTDEMARVALQAYQVTPIPLSIADVLTGLQTGLIDTVGGSPIAAIALQWHTQVQYVTDLPVLYVYALLAIDQKAYRKISPQDQQVVDEVMTEVFAKIDKQNRKDNVAAAEALRNQGIKFIEPSAAELGEWHAKAEAAVARLVEQGVVSRSILDQLERHLADFRTQQTANN